MLVQHASVPLRSGRSHLGSAGRGNPGPSVRYVARLVNVYEPGARQSKALNLRMKHPHCYIVYSRCIFLFDVQQSTLCSNATQKGPGKM